MDDVVQKVKKLMSLARDQTTTVNERLAAALGALEIIEKYKLLSGDKTGKPVDIAASIFEKATNPDFVEQIVSRAEKVASGVDRFMDAVDRVAKRGTREPAKRRRTYR